MAENKKYVEPLRAETYYKLERIMAMVVDVFGNDTNKVLKAWMK